MIYDLFETLVGRAYDFDLAAYAISSGIFSDFAFLDYPWIISAVFITVCFYWFCKSIFSVFGVIFGGRR